MSAMLGAILYKSQGSRGIMPLAGCRGSAHAGVKGWNPCSKQTLNENCLLGVEAVLRLVEDLAGVLLKDF